MGLRKGMVLIGEHAEPRATWRFMCDVLVLHSSTTMRCNYQPVLHVRNVRQVRRGRARGVRLRAPAAVRARGPRRGWRCSSGSTARRPNAAGR